MRKLKYEPLGRYLERETRDEVKLTFAEIEATIGASLPRSARTYQAWWANEVNPRPHVHKVAWLRVGWHTAKLDLAAETVEFRRD